jgi:hypothetical protein
MKNEKKKVGDSPADSSKKKKSKWTELRQLKD